MSFFESEGLYSSRRKSIASRTFLALVGATAILHAAGSQALASPWAGHVASFDAGTTPQFGYGNPESALGLPERFTGESEFGGIYAGPVTLFNPAWGGDELVSIGEGGHLTLELSTPATDDPGHLFGVDLILFGNAGFDATDYPSMGATASIFQPESGRIEVSDDGVHFFEIPNWTADGLFPTLGYSDVEGFSSNPGNVPTDFFKPVNPAITLSDFNSLTHEQAVSLYDGSGGGTPIDIASVGLSSVSHIRISLDDDANALSSLSVEVDAVTVVPEPTGLAHLIVVSVIIMARTRSWTRRG